MWDVARAGKPLVHYEPSMGSRVTLTSEGWCPKQVLLIRRFLISHFLVFNFAAKSNQFENGQVGRTSFQLSVRFDGRSWTPAGELLIYALGICFYGSASP